MVIRKKESKNFHEILIWSSVIGLEILNWMHAKFVQKLSFLYILAEQSSINQNSMLPL